ncbi:MAG: aldo/keto reductase [Burkholderiales bacterium]|nr:aldo/keto reductase [Burkholderiales bacterium]
MEMRALGRSSLRVAPLCFGGNVFGWTADEATSFSLLDAFVDGGFNFIDTADVYSRWVPGHQGGESETIIGKWLQRGGRRDRVVIATKVGMEMGKNRKGLSAGRIRIAVEESLKRLQTDHIDLYFSHTDDADTPLEETLQLYGELIKEGKVRTIGASNYGEVRLRQALGTSERLGLPRYEALQPEYNLYARAGFEHGLQAACRDAGLGVVPYYALASGFLTGKYRSENDFDKSPRGARMTRYLNERGLRILAALDAAAQRLNATPAQVSLAWLMRRPCITAPIASATSLAQLDELMAAARLVLDESTMAALDAASAGD